MPIVVVHRSAVEYPSFASPEPSVGDSPDTAIRKSLESAGSLRQEISRVYVAEASAVVHRSAGEYLEEVFRFHGSPLYSKEQNANSGKKKMNSAAGSASSAQRSYKSWGSTTSSSRTLPGSLKGSSFSTTQQVGSFARQREGRHQKAPGC